MLRLVSRELDPVDPMPLYALLRVVLELMMFLGLFRGKLHKTRVLRHSTLIIASPPVRIRNYSRMPPPSSTPEVTITTKITTTKRKIEITARRDLSPPATKRKVVSTTTSLSPEIYSYHVPANCGEIGATVANFFKPASAKESEKTTWRAVEKSLVIAKYVPTNYSETTSLDNTEPRRIAGFDLVQPYYTSFPSCATEKLME